MKRKLIFFVLGLTAMLCCPAQTRTMPADSVQVLTGYPNLFRHGSVYISAQPSLEAFHWLKEQGLARVINLRTAKEVQDHAATAFNEASLCRELGLDYHHIEVGGSAAYQPDILDSVSLLLDTDSMVLVHCQSGGRSIQLYMAHLVKAGFCSLDEAVAVGKQLGYRFPLEQLLGRKIHLEYAKDGDMGTMDTIRKDPLAHTFSIVARDPQTGEMAVAVQSHWFSVGSMVSWGRSGVGVVATQSFVNPAFGPDGLLLMSGGMTAQKALAQLVKADEGRDGRQVAFLDARGNVAAHTGKYCIESASHLVGKDFAVQANMMLNDRVVPAMAEAFEQYRHLPLAERMVEVLAAAQAAGGDIRGRQSAALLVVGGDKVEEAWLDHQIDLRVDDHPQPVAELRRLLLTHRAYEHMNMGDEALLQGDMERALKEYSRAEGLLPGNLEIRYWKAVTLANNKRVEEALPIFAEVFAADENWRLLTRRLPASRQLDVCEEEYLRILAQGREAVQPGGTGNTRGPEHGSLMVIGGGKVGQEIMDEFIRRAGGKDARIVVIPTAAGDDFLEREGALKEIENEFRAYGMEYLTVLHTRDRADANDETFIAPLKEATGLYFTGGRQWRIADSFLHTRAHEEMFRLLERGGVIAGSSAGATIQGSYLARGDTKNNQIMAGDHEEGLGFISQVAIDQHVLARNRQFDMFDILKKRPELLGISIDEGTAMVVEGDSFEVMGPRYVLVYDGTFWSREGTSKKTIPDAGSRFYMLRAGDRYDLKARKVIGP